MSPLFCLAPLLTTTFFLRTPFLFLILLYRSCSLREIFPLRGLLPARAASREVFAGPLQDSIVASNQDTTAASALAPAPALAITPPWPPH
ncbi:hypothetical protein BJX64DRAFT_249046 [Aspergillus heterothallicus]